METSAERRKLTQPLESVASFSGMFLLIATVGGVALAVFGSGSIFGFGNGDVCAIQPGSYSNSNWTVPPGVAPVPRPGTSVIFDAPLRACTSHPGFGQRVLATLTDLPGWLVWAGVLLLLWQIIRSARRNGPFTPRAARAMRRLGWLILAGSVVSTIVQALAAQRLLSSLVTGSDPSFAYPLFLAARNLVPVPALAGAALLTFASIVRLGAAMDDEIKGTV